MVLDGNSFCDTPCRNSLFHMLTYGPVPWQRKQWLSGISLQVCEKQISIFKKKNYPGEQIQIQRSGAETTEAGHKLVIFLCRATPTFPDCAASQRDGKPHQVPPPFVYPLARYVLALFITPLKLCFTLSPWAVSKLICHYLTNEWDRLPDCVFIGQSMKEHDTLITGQHRQSELVNHELQHIKKSDHGWPRTAVAPVWFSADVSTESVAYEGF